MAPQRLALEQASSVWVHFVLEIYIFSFKGQNGEIVSVSAGIDGHKLAALGL